jgi:hypothetical protein
MDGNTKDKDVDRIAAKIRALLSKTTDNGCTESEAVAAANKVASMLAEHELTLDEVKIREDRIEERVHPVDDVVGQHLWKVAEAVAKLCQVRQWSRCNGRVDESVVFFGLSCDVEVAEYLLVLVERAMRAEAERYEAGTALFRPSVRRRRQATFVDGMADRLRERIREIAWTKTKRVEGAGQGLVVVRNALIDGEMIRRKIALKAGSAFSQDVFPGYAAGRLAAQAIALEAAVETGPTAAVYIEQGKQ